MTPEQAKEWVERHKSGTDDEAARALLALVASVRAQAIGQAAEVCEREARACHGHAKSFKLDRPKRHMPIFRAHEMAGNQSSACAHYVRALVKS